MLLLFFCWCFFFLNAFFSFFEIEHSMFCSIFLYAVLRERLVMVMCLSIVTLFLTVGSEKCYVVFSSSWVSGGCCQVLVGSRGGFFSSFIEIQLNVIELSDFYCPHFNYATCFFTVYVQTTLSAVLTISRMINDRW